MLIHARKRDINGYKMEEKQKEYVLKLGRGNKDYSRSSMGDVPLGINSQRVTRLIWIGKLCLEINKMVQLKLD
ncbi:hypothetical protein NDU88_009742 [Pleurodeles waltl]|uniref:Uncharacterized protein n=1 Tax=Pleurodeles waltl TaxID=8319 RepID=A0AAV7RW31_PLEWA|nr:hypothetical protein NDU88_009742 [Pleurodeles waltl]